MDRADLKQCASVCDGHVVDVAQRTKPLLERHDGTDSSPQCTRDALSASAFHHIYAVSPIFIQEHSDHRGFDTPMLHTHAHIYTRTHRPLQLLKINLPWASSATVAPQLWPKSGERQ